VAPQPHFREVQRFRQPWLWVALLGSVAVVCFVVYQQILALNHLGNYRPVSTNLPLIPACLSVLMLVWFWKAGLVTEVYDDAIRVQMVWMWRAKRIPFTQIRSVEAVTYRPIVEYGGWGIRRGANGWAYNVSGNRGVRIHYLDGTSFLIGSARAEELAAAIAARLGAR
jgi:hypothetical protein